MGSITDIKDPVLDRPTFDPRQEFSESTRTGENKPVSEVPSSAPQSDVSGSTLLTPIRDYTLPPTALGNADLEKALSTLQGKTTQIQQSVSLVMSLYTPEDRDVTPTVNDLVNDLFRAATSSSGASALNAFCRSLEDMISQAQARNQGQEVKNVCDTARELIDLLHNPKAAREDIINCLNSLQQMAGKCDSDNPAEKLASGLAIILGAALSALDLSNELNKILVESGRTGFTLPPNLAEMSGLMTVVAMMSLLALVSTQVSAEIEARMNLTEDEDKLREQRNVEQKKQDEKRARDKEKESVVDQAQSSSMMNNALTQSFGEVLGGGMDDAFTLVMNKVIEARQRSRTTIEA